MSKTRERVEKLAALLDEEIESVNRRQGPAGVITRQVIRERSSIVISNLYEAFHAEREYLNVELDQKIDEDED